MTSLAFAAFGGGLFSGGLHQLGTSVLTGAISGLSLGSSIWNATHKPKEQTSYSQFDQMMNTVSSETFISIIYGQRKWAGAQLYHKASADGLGLTKDILIGEGTIGGVYGVCANDVLLQTGSVFTLKNIDYADATVTITSGNLRLYANSVATDIPLVTTKDDIVTWDYNVTIDKLIGHLGTIGNGWVVGNAVNCANGTTEIHVITETPCYNSATSMTVTGLDGCTYEFHDGSPTQAPPSNYEVVGGYKNMAWLRVNLVYSAKLSSGGNPTISYIVNGIKVLDTRTGVTATSSNPAMITRNLLLSKRYGAAMFIPNIAELLDEDSFKEVADYCDESVNYIDSNGITHSEPRYTTNIIIDTKKNLSEVLDDILASYGGFLVLANGKIGLRIEAPCVSSYDFTSDTIVAESFSMEQLSIDETPNKYLVGYFDMTQNWTQVKCIVEDSIDQQPKPIGRGKVISKELTLTGCTSQSQAIRQGRLQKLKNKLCSLTATWKTSTFAMHIQPGDVVTTTYDKVDDNGEVLRIIDKMPWRILEVSQQDGVYTLKGRQYNASIYGDVTEVIEIKYYTPLQKTIIADTAVALAVPRLINGVPFDGTGNIVTSATLPNVVTEGTYTKVTVSAKGIVEYGSNPSTIEDLGISNVYTKDAVDTKIGLGIELRISGATLQASLDNGITWKTVTLT